MRLIHWVAALTITAGVWQTGQGAYIHAKAELAQLLMTRAWNETHRSGRDTRPWRWADTWPVAKLLVPDYGVEQIVLNGETGNVLAFGPGLVNGSAKPGAGGPVVISGHRDTHFGFLENLSAGDRLLLQPPGGATVRYRVTAGRVFDTREPGPPPYSTRSGLWLVTCFPFDAIAPGGPLRYLVEARQDPSSL